MKNVPNSRLFQTFPDRVKKEHIFPDFSEIVNPAIKGGGRPPFRTMHSVENLNIT